jgi:hypothetical protein
VIIFVTYYTKLDLPILGIVASLFFFISIIWFHKASSPVNPPPKGLWELDTYRPLLIISLVLPQIILTFANSVLATVNVSQKYFGDQAQKVTVRRLVSMIGFGNIFSSLIGGLPFCHGSGGITAHYQGGARSNGSNYIIGTSLLIAAIAAYLYGNTQIIFSPLWLSVLLLSVGIMHVSLAKPSWIVKGSLPKLQLATMGAVALVSGNMLWVIASGIIFEFYRKRFS